MTELELQHLRRERWRLEGDPLRTFDEARGFVESVGMCLMYPIRSMPVLPTLMGASAGTDANLPARNAAFSDPRSKHAEELAMRMIRQKAAFAAQFAGEMLLVSVEVF